jgi:riboflavin kinase / FMN adenylyltransferase
MAVFHIPWQSAFPNSCRQGALTIGNFDGVHRGHVALLGRLKEKAKMIGGPAVALTFDPHPVCLLQPKRCPPALSTPADRADLMQQFGADHVLMLGINHDMLDLRAAEFFDRILRAQLAPRAMVEGANFAFGHNREGNVDTLARLCADAGIDFVPAPPILVEGSPVSSSRVRAALTRGDVASAARLLGRYYRLRGVVGSGQKRGHSLGFPTANLEQIQTLTPGDGVYAVRVEYDGTTWPGAANVGPNPTFGEQARTVEAHLIGFHGELYGHELAIDFLERLRDARRFSGPSELAAQLKRDIEQARRFASQTKDKP